MEKLSSFPVKEGTKQHFSHPVIYNGVLFIRRGNSLIGYDVKRKDGWSNRVSFLVFSLPVLCFSTVVTGLLDVSCRIEFPFFHLNSNLIGKFVTPFLLSGKWVFLKFNWVHSYWFFRYFCLADYWMELSAPLLIWVLKFSFRQRECPVKPGIKCYKDYI